MQEVSYIIPKNGSSDALSLFMRTTQRINSVPRLLNVYLLDTHQRKRDTNAIILLAGSFTSLQVSHFMKMIDIIRRYLQKSQLPEVKTDIHLQGTIGQQCMIWNLLKKI